MLVSSAFPLKQTSHFWWSGFVCTCLSVHKWPCWLTLPLQICPASSSPGLTHSVGLILSATLHAHSSVLIFSFLKLWSMFCWKCLQKAHEINRRRGCVLKAIVTPGRGDFFFFFLKALISILHLSAHLPSGNTVGSPFPNSSLSLMEKLGRKRSLKTFLGIEATRACCCTIMQADPFESNF